MANDWTMLEVDSQKELFQKSDFRIEGTDAVADFSIDLFWLCEVFVATSFFERGFHVFFEIDDDFVARGSYLLISVHKC